ncbi:PPE family protein [Mycobacterium angelicum]|uniref:PPE domain-containing protein n=1 Tax=Mycobacterium angelicum TaxID=470074 RepID=A0A1X0A3V9_MYCAN|nr:PPE family protein [Mycobacterium angelicum]MCV7197875.1 PPE family protein [Mycobacterium angelicum]ORA24740.1 hypothetical protein BST12_04555 [Mycobacterium angelicum]
MDFGELPPEVNSARMYSGAGSEPMVVAAAAWDKLADDLYATAALYNSTLTALTDDGWQGPASDAMVAAVAPYLGWLTGTAAQAQAIAGQARAAASAFENACVATVPPPVIDENRARLASLIKGNVISQDTPAITALEADYGEMWAQDASAMYRYAGASASAATLDPLRPPMSCANIPGPTGLDADADTPDALAQAMSGIPQALRSLGNPVQSASSSAAMTSLLRLRPFVSAIGPFAAAISSPASMTPSGTSAAMAGSPKPTVQAAWGASVVVGRLVVPPSWGGAAFGSLRSIA